jgi:hypothetical protein
MKRLFLALVALALPAGALAQTQVGGKYVANPPTLADGQQAALRLDPTGAQVVSGGATPGGNATNQSGTLDYCSVVTGNQTYTVGTIQPLNCITTGRLKVGLSMSTNLTPAAAPATTLDSLLIGCTYYTQVTWTAGWQGPVRCDAQGNQAVTTRGSQQLATTQVSVGTTATLLAAARADRARINITVTAANTCAIGNTGVTTTTGYPLQPTAGVSMTLETNAAVYAVCSATTTVGVLEQF